MAQAKVSRRRFLTATALAGLALPQRLSSNPAPPLRAAIIGHTGQGDYGHGLDLIFRGRRGIQVVAVADPGESGRTNVQSTYEGAIGYADWRTLLEQEKPRLVSIGMRHSTLHHEVVMACLKAAAHVYVEKPFVQFPAQADELLEEARRRNRRIAVAHTLRALPAARNLRQALKEGHFGRLVELRGVGKQDARAGGEDMMVLGTHVFDLMRLFAGDPQWCTGRVVTQGRDIQGADRRRVKDEVGWVAGEDVAAQFGFAAGVLGSFRSCEAAKQSLGPWGLELVTERALIRFSPDVAPHVFAKQPAGLTASGRSETWTPWDPAVLKEVPPLLDPVGDWLDAIDEQREPECGGLNGAWAIEMVMAVYRAALGRSRVEFPLKDRGHPLG